MPWTMLLPVLLSSGTLDGVVVVVSPGHGLSRTEGGYRSCREPQGGLLEDLETVETTSLYLVDLLRRAGAEVWSCRCESLTPYEVTCDNDDPHFRESGPWKALPYGYKGSARYLEGTTGAWARFRPFVPQSGRYPLYVRYVSLHGKAGVARVRVRHGGGTSERCISEDRYGGLWRYVGSYYFFAGLGQEIEIRPAGPEPISVDAVRIGGGTYTLPAGELPGTTQLLRSDLGALPYLRYLGVPEAVWDLPGETHKRRELLCRPRFAEWVSAGADRRVFISYHTNAGGGSGTETYVFSGRGDVRSRRLARLIQEEIVKNIRRTWNPAWVDRGVKAAAFAELGALRSCPGVLIESAFHDNPSDREAEKSPRWRRAVARAVYRALARYFGGENAVLLPPSPCSVRAFLQNGAVQLRWDEPAEEGAACRAQKAEEYLIHTSSDGFAFSLLGKTKSTSVPITDIPHGAPVFFRITAVNRGGRSLPSRTAGVLASRRAALRALFVHASRSDTGVLRRLQCLSGSGEKVLRFFPARSPSGGDGVVEHLWALAAAQPERFSVDFAEASCVTHRLLSRYRLVIVAFGEEPQRPPQFLKALRDYAASGGCLLASGSSLPGLCPDRRSGGYLPPAFSPSTPTPARPQGISAVRSPSGLSDFALRSMTDWGLNGPGRLAHLEAPRQGVPFLTAGATPAGVLLPPKKVLLCFPFESVPFAPLRTLLLEDALALLFGRSGACRPGEDRPARRSDPPAAFRSFHRWMSICSPQEVRSFLVEAWYRGSFQLFLNGRLLLKRSKSEWTHEWIECVQKASGVLQPGRNLLCLQGRGESFDVALHLFLKRRGHHVVIPPGSPWQCGLPMPSGSAQVAGVSAVR